MLKSMTGYGRDQQLIGGRDILVEIRSVNHRYFEFSARVPRAYGYLEEKMKSYVQSRVSRGKIDVNVSVFTAEGQDAVVELNRSLARGYLDALRSSSEELALPDDLSLTALARFPDVFTVRKAEVDEEVIWEAVKTVAENALDHFVAMREKEGEKMLQDISGRLDTIEGWVGEIEKLSPETTKAYRERLFAKLQEVLDGKEIDESRIVTEAAIFSEKIAVDEETVRLRSHLNQYRALLKSPEAVGRKLDFLTQEVNREINTIGSKAQDLAITRIVVDLKSEVEKNQRTDSEHRIEEGRL